MNAIVVNLAWRGQLLADRQLHVLARLLRAERHPDRLAALHQLDHLAARARRNSANVLILTGRATRMTDQPDVPLAEIPFAALAGPVGPAEPHQRTHVDIGGAARIAATAAADLAHLTGELLDNALAFSPPQSPVQVTGGATAAGGWLRITDRGMGLADEALAEANALLGAGATAPADMNVAASERMGLAVVANLAARHGIRVMLAQHDAGTRAELSIPPELLVGGPRGSDDYHAE